MLVPLLVISLLGAFAMEVAATPLQDVDKGWMPNSSRRQLELKQECPPGYKWSEDSKSCQPA